MTTEKKWTEAQIAAMSLRGKTLLVSAAAGSGKTATLTERVIRSLTDKTEPRGDLSRMLIVTFTRAAATELKSRISEALTGAIAHDPSDRHLTRQLLNLGSAHISTIDAFYLEPIRQNCDRLGLPADFRMADEAELDPLRRSILDDLIDEYYDRYAPAADGPRILSYKSRAAHPFAALLDSLLDNRSDENLDNRLLKLFRRLAYEPTGTNRLIACAEELESAVNADFFNCPQGRALRDSIQSTVLPIFRELEKDMEEITQNSHLSKLLSPAFNLALAACRRILAAETYAAMFAAFPIKITAPAKRKAIVESADGPDFLYYVEKFRTRMATLTKLGALCTESLETVQTQIAATAAHARMLASFYTEYGNRLRAEKQRRGICDFDDIRHYMIELLLNPDGTPTELGLAYQSRFDAVYIDEYQDVDAVQDAIFACVGAGGKRFMVGDIKQSIYGFRGAEPSIFAHYRAAFPLWNTPGADKAEGNCVFMSDNFRCDESVIRFTNLVCSYIFSACPETVGYRPEDDLRFSKTCPSGYDCPPVEFTLIDRSNDAAEEEIQPEESDLEEESANEEATYIAARVAQLLDSGRLSNGKPIYPKDIAILYRSARPFREVAQALEALHIPVTYNVSEDLSQTPEMHAMMNCLSAINNPRQDMPLLGLLTGPFFGFTLNEVATARLKTNASIPLYDTILREGYVKEEDGTRTISNPKAAAFIDWVEKYRMLASSLPIDRLVRRLYTDERIAPFADRPALLCLYEHARRYQNASYCGLYSFLSYFGNLLHGGKELAAEGLQKEEDAVTLMTEHSAKGLEFPVVVVGGLGSAFQTRDTGEALLCDHTLGFAIRLFDPERQETIPTILTRLLGQKMLNRLCEEEMRILYVALTRAQERLILTALTKSKPEAIEKKVALIHRQDPLSILAVRRPFLWILAAMNDYENSHKNSLPYRRQILTSDEVAIMPKPDYHMANSTEQADAHTPDADPVLTAFTDILRRGSSFVYPDAHLRGLPSKAAASGLDPHLLDTLRYAEEHPDQGEAAGLLHRRIFALSNETDKMTADVLLERKKKPTAAERGTAAHAFLEFCDYARMAKSGVEEELARLVENKFIPRGVAEMIDPHHLTAFAQSSLYAELQMARWVRREQRFSVFLPLRDFTEDPQRKEELGDRRLYVQGSIDLCFESAEGELVLVDYKTDHLRAEERGNLSAFIRRMNETHGEQLRVYRTAMTNLFGRAPNRILIYSMPLGETIPITLPD